MDNYGRYEHACHIVDTGREVILREDSLAHVAMVLKEKLCILPEDRLELLTNGLCG